MCFRELLPNWYIILTTLLQYNIQIGKGTLQDTKPNAFTVFVCACLCVFVRVLLSRQKLLASSQYHRANRILCSVEIRSINIFNSLLFTRSKIIIWNNQYFYAILQTHSLQTMVPHIIRKDLINRGRCNYISKELHSSICLPRSEVLTWKQEKPWCLCSQTTVVNLWEKISQGQTSYSVYGYYSAQTHQ